MDPEEGEAADAMDLEEGEEEATIVTATARGDMAAEEVAIVVFPETDVIVMTFNKKMTMQKTDVEGDDAEVVVVAVDEEGDEDSIPIKGNAWTKATVAIEAAINITTNTRNRTKVVMAIMMIMTTTTTLLHVVDLPVEEDDSAGDPEEGVSAVAAGLVVAVAVGALAEAKTVDKKATAEKEDKTAEILMTQGKQLLCTLLLLCRPTTAADTVGEVSGAEDAAALLPEGRMFRIFSRPRLGFERKMVKAVTMLKAVKLLAKADLAVNVPEMERVVLQ